MRWWGAKLTAQRSKCCQGVQQLVIRLGSWGVFCHVFVLPHLPSYPKAEMNSRVPKQG